MTLLFALALTVVLANFFWLRFRHDATLALGTSIVASYWFPTYWVVDVLGNPISVQTASAALCLFAFVLTRGSLAFRLNMLDIAIGSIMVVHAVSDGVVHGEGPLAIVRAYGEWMLAYASGRYAFGSIEALRNARFHIWAFFAISLSIWMVDVFGGINVCFDVTEMFADWEPPRRTKRYGIIRTAGLTTHPIFFSALLMSMLPLAVASLGWTYKEQFNRRYLTAAVSLGIGCLFLSRAAVLSIFAAAGVFATTMSRKVLFAGLVSVAIGIGAVAMNFEAAKTMWMKTGDFSDEREKVVVINGEEKIHTSTLARFRVYDVYGRSAMRAGFFGYGTQAVSGFPPNIPYLPKEAMATEVVWTVENSYLLLLLRFGWVGLACFLLLMVSPMITMMTAREFEVREQMQIFVAAAASVSVLLFTVYADYQMIGAFLFLLGVTSSLADPRIGVGDE
ncbi:hypothetical protein Pla22_48420 [Rubripirellula amarantea]|uniref:O-antigen ligase-related domain-containing protein n=1 Tax=Rubripirellula amarantea TaxID=2527999 RepID=A0A5C5WFV8_9BACT|nr:O-antigen ligase family protein [Rubripirellula amarantea]TWT49644.1 hypothetical protein Pla22_48420 [Rubripirellula amarantea]